MSSCEQHDRESKIDDVCWQLCSSNYLERDNPVFPDDCVYKLFRVFCMLGDMVENDKGQVEVSQQEKKWKASVIVNLL